MSSTNKTNYFYTKSEIDSMGGGTSLSDTISQKANASDLTAHTNNTDIHVTSKDKTTWNAKQNALSTAQLNACNSGITSDKVNQYDEYIGGASGQPVGSILWVMGSTVPAGYLICNGSAVSRTAYAKLFQVIGTKYGEGDGSSTFNLPNLINRFLQGSETSGTVKEAGLPNITGNFEYVYGVSSYTSSGGAFSLGLRGFNRGGNADGGDGAYKFMFDASLSNSIYGNSETVQPPAITSIPCIKAFDSVIDATTVSVAELADTKVNKAGDTMTGNLLVNGSNDENRLVLNNDVIGSIYFFADKVNKVKGLYCVHPTLGGREILRVFNDNTSKIEATKFIGGPNNIDCSVDSQGNGYIRYSNGLQICWGSIVTTTKLMPITFGKPFATDLSYGVSTCPSVSNLGVYINAGDADRTPTGVTLTTDVPDGIHRRVDWNVIGRWK